MLRFQVSSALRGARYQTWNGKITDAVTHWLRGIHQVSVGGELGRNARPLHPDWVRSLRDDCAVAGIAFHFKQWGEYLHSEHSPEIVDEFKQKQGTGELQQGEWIKCGKCSGFARVGADRAGRKLDGREYNELIWRKGNGGV